MIYKFIRLKLTIAAGLCVLFGTSPSFAQSSAWKIGLGNSLTTYDFVTTQGVQINYLKKGSGNAYSIGYEQAFLDTTKFIGQGTSKDLYYLQHKSLAKILSHLEWSSALLMNQFNAVGDVQNTSFDYQTNYLGLELGIGPFVNLGKGWKVQAQGKAMGQYLLQGNQHVGSAYVDLSQNKDFNQLKVFVGYAGILEKKINKSLSLYVSAAKNQTFVATKQGESSLNFKTLNMLFGIKIIGL